jgi:hypothetical protein
MNSDEFRTLARAVIDADEALGRHDHDELDVATLIRADRLARDAMIAWLTRRSVGLLDDNPVFADAEFVATRATMRDGLIVVRRSELRTVEGTGHA